MTEGYFRSYLMFKFILYCFSILGDLEEQRGINHSVKSFLTSPLFSLFRTAHFPCYPLGLIPNLLCAIFQIKCSRDCLLPPVEKSSGMVFH